jgi:2-dehydro-3-deoxyphosphogluconate aldolase/(4S)-4-hydroxy-2-oxoglutarate aldolase
MPRRTVVNDLLNKIGEIGIVPVVKIEGSDKEEIAEKAIGLGKALVSGGIPVAEITFRTAAAPDAIRAMAGGVPEILVGAGTVTSVELARSAVESGARFVVCPAWDEGVVDYCLERGVSVLPGVSGPDGVARGLAKGLEALKFFPAEASGGVAMLDALAGPFGSMRFVPTGGIDGSNIGAYARRAQVLAVGGSWMVQSKLVEAKDWEGIERLTREAVLALHGFSFAHVGVNETDADTAAKDAASFASLFGLAPKEGAASIFMSDVVELMKAPYLGERGHLAIRCNDVERAVARFRALGISTLADTIRKDRGRIKSVYLDLVLGGFAIHLLRAA